MDETSQRNKWEFWRRVILSLSKCGPKKLQEMVTELLPGFKLEMKPSTGSRILDPEGKIVGSELHNIEMAKSVLDLSATLYGYDVESVCNAKHTEVYDSPISASEHCVENNTMIDSGIHIGIIDPEVVREDITNAEEQVNEIIRVLSTKTKGRLKIILKGGRVEFELDIKFRRK